MNRPIYQGEADLPVFAKVRFTVDEEGNLLYPSIIRGIDPYLDKKALEIINGKLLKQMPRWNPATLRGENIASSIVLPIRYILIYK
ncbi:MAG: energy transducer TonB [Bacteroides sp.]|nr:energy transducer TonB [Bacteroides sp.]MDO5421121.1 energy transducer TonB [Bacteroides sp.]